MRSLADISFFVAFFIFIINIKREYKHKYDFVFHFCHFLLSFSAAKAGFIAGRYHETQLCTWHMINLLIQPLQFKPSELTGVCVC